MWLASCTGQGGGQAPRPSQAPAAAGRRPVRSQLSGSQVCRPRCLNSEPTPSPIQPPPGGPAQDPAPSSPRQGAEPLPGPRSRPHSASSLLQVCRAPGWGPWARAWHPLPARCSDPRPRQGLFKPSAAAGQTSHRPERSREYLKTWGGGQALRGSPPRSGRRRRDPKATRHPAAASRAEALGSDQAPRVGPACCPGEGPVLPSPPREDTAPARVQGRPPPWSD